jgi:hypothetical protein
MFFNVFQCFRQKSNLWTSLDRWIREKDTAEQHRTVTCTGRMKLKVYSSKQFDMLALSSISGSQIGG